MKYNIFDYNQKKAVELGLDLKDLLILNWIQTFYPKMHKTIRDGKQYFWVKYSAVLQDIPILEIDSEKGLYKRMKKMCEIGILEYLPIRTAGGCFSYYLITEMMAYLVSSHSPQSYPEKPESYPQSPQSSYAIINSSTIYPSTINTKEKTNKKEIPVVKESLTTHPTCKVSLQVQSDIEKVYCAFLENEKARTDTIQFKKVAPKIKEALKECETIDILLERVETYLQYCKETKSWYSKKDIQAWFDAGFYSLEKEKHYKDGIAKEQAKQPKTEFQKLIQKPTYEVSEEVKEKINVAERRRQIILGGMNEFEKSELRYFQEQLPNYFTHQFEPLMKQLVLRIQGNKYYFGTMHEVLLKQKDKMEVKFKMERPDAEFELKLI